MTSVERRTSAPKTDYSPNDQAFLERIARSDRILFVLDTDRASSYLRKLRQSAAGISCGFYQWQQAPIEEERFGDVVQLDSAGGLMDALKAVERHERSGIFWFFDCNQQFRALSAWMQVATLLKTIVGGKTGMGTDKKIVLVGEKRLLPQEMEGWCEPIKGELDLPVRLRLRDGRWFK